VSTGCGWGWKASGAPPAVGGGGHPLDGGGGRGITVRVLMEPG
jgi:hypothetical protein